jgi:hypothetical protein
MYLEFLDLMIKKINKSIINLKIKFALRLP